MIIVQKQYDNHSIVNMEEPNANHNYVYMDVLFILTWSKISTPLNEVIVGLSEEVHKSCCAGPCTNRCGDEILKWSSVNKSLDKVLIFHSQPS